LEQVVSARCGDKQATQPLEPAVRCHYRDRFRVIGFQQPVDRRAIAHARADDALGRVLDVGAGAHRGGVFAQSAVVIARTAEDLAGQQASSGALPPD
jgi:D-serine deaminase-like pyridoxal phosphate-dependent protein